MTCLFLQDTLRILECRDQEALNPQALEVGSEEDSEVVASEEVLDLEEASCNTN